jgi:hypothetical protein
VLFPVFAVMAFMFVQAALWQHDRLLAGAAADRASSAVALYGASPTETQADAATGLTAVGMKHLRVSVTAEGDRTVVEVDGDAPGILIGTSLHVHARSVTPTAGFRAP